MDNQKLIAEAEAGDPVAQYNLGRVYKADPTPLNSPKAVEWITRAANQGYIEAEFLLGMMYKNGDAVPSNPVKAKAWFTRASQKGHVEAELALSMCI